MSSSSLLTLELKHDKTNHVVQLSLDTSTVGDVYNAASQLDGGLEVSKIVGLWTGKEPPESTFLSALPKVMQVRTKDPSNVLVRVMVIGTKKEILSFVESQDVKMEVDRVVEEIEREELERRHAIALAEQLARDEERRIYQENQRIQWEKERQEREQRRIEEERVRREERIAAGYIDDDEDGGRGHYGEEVVDPNASLTLEYPVFCSSSLPSSVASASASAATSAMPRSPTRTGSSFIAASDKIILPQVVLNKALAAKVPFPLLFEISRKQTSFTRNIGVALEEQQREEKEERGRHGTGPNVEDDGKGSEDIKTYAAVADFSAPDGTVIAPHSIFKALKLFLPTEQRMDVDGGGGVLDGESDEGGASLAEGTILILKTVTLPQGTSVTLQPQAMSWFRIPTEERVALLEFYMRKLSVLVEGQQIACIYDGVTQLLNVVNVLPASAVSITNTDLVTDVILPTKETMDKDAKLWTFLDLDDDAAPITFTLERKGQMKFFRFHVADAQDGIKLKLIVQRSASAGGRGEEQEPDADIYMCRDVQRPTVARHTWKQQSIAAVKEFVLDTSDMNFAVGPYFVSVRCFHGPVTFSLQVSRAPPPASASTVEDEEKGGSKGSSSRSSSSSSTSNSSSGSMSTQCSLVGSASDHKQSPLCALSVPSSSFEMHEVRCSRLNWRCPKCPNTVVLPVAERKKHVELMHTPLACVCGEEFDQEPLHVHQRTACIYRLTPCPFCGLRTKTTDISAHKKECSLRTAQCCECKEVLKRREMRFHISKTHGKQLDAITPSMWH